MAAVMMLEDAAQPEVWHRSKTAITKSGVAVPLLFRVATSADAYNPLRQHKRRGLWKMPVRQALEAVQSGAADEEEAPPERVRPRGRGSVQGGRHGKRDRLDEDGDVVMVRTSRCELRRATNTAGLEQRATPGTGVRSGITGSLSISPCYPPQDLVDVFTVAACFPGCHGAVLCMLCLGCVASLWLRRSRVPDR